MITPRSLFMRRHYEWLADWWSAALDKAPNPASHDAMETMLRNQVDALQNENPNFKPVRFLQRVGYTRSKAEALLERAMF